MRKHLFFPLLFLLGCSSPPPVAQGPTYRECLLKQDKLRETRFNEMPSSLKVFAGKQSVVKYFEKRPKDLLSIVKQVMSENATFNLRHKNDDDADDDLTRLDTSSSRSRILMGFEKRRDLVFAKSDQDRLVFKMDYSKPVVGYYFPLSAIKPQGKGFGGSYSSTVNINAPKSYGGSKTLGKINISFYIEAVDKNYIYLEWINHSYDPQDAPDWKGIRTLLFTGDPDKFLDWEHPYFDNRGELNPEDCNSLEGG